MPNVIRRPLLDDSIKLVSQEMGIQSDIQLTSLPCPKLDALRQLPTEIRLAIFDALLISAKTVFRGAKTFGPLSKKEFDEEVPLSWQILAACRTYFNEGMPIMYGKNRFAFCTGSGGEPGMFWRFPIKIRCMAYLSDIGIYFRADDPKKEASKRIGYFIKALSRHATNLQFLLVVASSDRFFENMCPWDIVFCNHPVSQALDHLVQSSTVKHLKLRIHDGAYFFPQWAQYLAQTFKAKRPAPCSIGFAKSCSCHVSFGTTWVDSYGNVCCRCEWPMHTQDQKPLERVVDASGIESNEERMMEMQDYLFELGVLPESDNDGDGNGNGEVVHENENPGPYISGHPMDDVYEDSLLAFDSGV